jgi:hypothetical protein
MSQGESEPTKPDLTTMGRPKKDENDLRRRWSVLNVTRSEREAIEAYAREAGCSTCSYIVSRAENGNAKVVHGSGVIISLRAT